MNNVSKAVMNVFRFTVLVAMAMALTIQLAGVSSSCAYRGTQVANAEASARSGDAPRGESAAGIGSEETQQDDFRWRGTIAAGRVVEIKGVNGSIRAEPSAGGDTEVTAEKRGRRSDPQSVRVQVVEHADGVTICAVYPSSDANKPNTCEPGDSGRSQVRDNDVKVDFTVRVPAGVRFSGRTVNGGVDANSLGADTDVHTVNGDVRVSTSGVARARTVNGSINASLGRADWTSPLDFKTVNGSITLLLPAAASAEVRAETVNGDISTDFPITIQGRFSKRSLNGTIGGGGRELRLATVNGSIEIRRAQ